MTDEEAFKLMANRYGLVDRIKKLYEIDEIYIGEISHCFACSTINPWTNTKRASAYVREATLPLFFEDYKIDYKKIFATEITEDELEKVCKVFQLHLERMERESQMTLEETIRLKSKWAVMLYHAEAIENIYNETPLSDYSTKEEHEEIVNMLAAVQSLVKKGFERMDHIRERIHKEDDANKE